MVGVALSWFVEIRNPIGKWQACVITGDYPTEQHYDQRRVFRMPPKLIPDYMNEPTLLPLETLCKFLSPDGEFAGYEDDICRAIVEFLRDPDLETMVIREDQRDAT